MNNNTLSTCSKTCIRINGFIFTQPYILDNKLKITSWFSVDQKQFGPIKRARELFSSSLVNEGAISSIIKPNLNSTNTEIRRATMLVIGSASQSNPKVQIAFMEHGILTDLLRIIATEKEPSVISRAVYSISCLIRGFPYGQQLFVSNGGISVFKEILEKDDWKFNIAQMKILTLIDDMIEERATAVGDRRAQLASIPLRKILLDNGWCSILVNLAEKIFLSTEIDNINDRYDEIVIKLLKSMNNIKDYCEFKRLYTPVKLLKKIYEERLARDTENSYGLSTAYSEILSMLNTETVKSEL